MKRYIILIPALAMALLSGCAKTAEAPDNDGQVPVSLVGEVSRATTPPLNNIYVKAFRTGGAPNVYFNETPARIAAGLSTTQANDITFPGVTPYYPLGGEEIAIIAYSGKAPNDRMVLTPGNSAANDFLLSNYGKRQSDGAVDPTYAPNGTPGSAADPVDLLQFRHVMTQLIVDVALGNPPVNPTPSLLQFTLHGGVVGVGYYPIRGIETDLAVDTTGTYPIKLGTNYLVPTGADLLGKKLKTLMVDNYTATLADLDGFIIQALEGQTDMRLLPGVSYRMTFTINRLQVTGIRLSKIDWVREEVPGDLTYQKKTLTLNLGPNYANTGTDAINKVLLTTTDGKTYVGEPVTGQTGVKFITLPASGVSTVSLYTERGKLLTTNIQPAQYVGNTLTLPISIGGMVPENPGLAPGPNNPYLITTPVQFMNVNKDLTANYKQATTVDLRNLNLVDDTRIFNGFGNFTGTYDGDGYRIDGIDIQAPGLFASIGTTSVLQDIRLTEGTIDASTSSMAGSICGVNNGTIVGCRNEARIISAAGSTPVGGIVGINSATGKVIGCINIGNIPDGTVVGGICGTNQNTNLSAFVSCINTGMLNPEATSLGFVCGTSTNSVLTVINTCFSLVGTAQHVLGSPEYAVGTGTVGITDSSPLEPAILRNNLPEGSTNPADRVVSRLNAALATTPWGTSYQYIYNNTATGITWPAPVKL